MVRAASELGITIRWQGHDEGEQGIAIDVPSASAITPGQCIVGVDARYFRPTEVDALIGDATKAREKLGWRPRTSFEDLVAEMMQADLVIARRDLLVTDAGYSTPSHRE